MIRILLTVGVVSLVTGAVEIAFAEGLSAVRRPFDFRGVPPNREPYKRATFHLILIAGLACVAAALVAWVLRVS